MVFKRLLTDFETISKKLIVIFMYFFFLVIKIFKDLCLRNYQKNNKNILKNHVKGIKTLLKKKKTESENMVANDIKSLINGKTKAS